MKKINVLLSTVNDVKDFVGIVSGYDFDVDLISGRFAVDAKSIIGIFSLDLSKPLNVNIYSDECEELIEQLQKFAAD